MAYERTKIQKHIIKLEIVGPKQMSAFLEKKVEVFREIFSKK